MPKIRITGVGVGSPVASANLSWEYADSGNSGPGAGGCLVLPSGQLPRVREIVDPIMLGVHPSSPVDGIRGPAGEPLPERVPAYVPRDVDDELARRLSASGFVVLVGDSAAGKSRAAYQAMLTLPNHVLIVPRDRASLPAALDKAAAMRRCVLWLDDLEGYLGSGGLTRAGIAGLLSGKRAHRVVVATLRSAEEALLTSEVPTAGFGLQHRREIHAVLGLAHRIGLQRVFSAPERGRAADLTWDPRIDEALAHADVFGIAEYLAAGPELMRDWENAWSANSNARAASHPRAAALIAAAVDVRRGGFTSPVPRALLDEVHERYLQERGGARLRPEPLADAWAWATRPRRATTALLEPDGNRHVQVFDYLLDRVQEQRGPGGYVPDEVMEAALAVASPADSDNIGRTAYLHARFQLQEKAYFAAYRARAAELGAEHLETLADRAERADSLRELRRFDESEAEFRAVADLVSRVHGPEHPLALKCRKSAAFAQIRQSQYGKAEAELRALQDISFRALGPEHDVTVGTHHLRAIALHWLGRLAEAEAENRFALRVLIQDFGPEDIETLLSRGNLAYLLYEAGRLEEAEQESRAVIAARTRVSGPAHPYTLQIRSLHADILRELGRPAEAAREHQEIVGIATAAHGPEHRVVLASRNGFAFALILQRKFTEAEQYLRATHDTASRAFGAAHEFTMASRHLHAIALHHLGRPDEAQAEHRLALDAWTGDLTRASQLIYMTELASVLQYARMLGTAEKQARQITDIRIRTLGRDHQATACAQSRLIIIQLAIKRYQEK